MKIVVAGHEQSEILRKLVKEISSRNHDVLMVCERGSALAKEFPEISCSSLEELPVNGKGYDRLIYLVSGNLEPELAGTGQTRDNRSVAVGGAGSLALINAAKAASIAEFMQVLAIRSIASSKTSDTVTREKEAWQQVDNLRGEGCYNVLVPHVVTGQADSSGRSGGVGEMLAGMVRPSISMAALARFLTSRLDDNAPGEICLPGNNGNNQLYRCLSRILDVAVCIAVLALFWWLYLVIWLAIRLTTGEAGLFFQTRIGKNGREFELYKFKTMKADTRQAGSHEVSSKAITPIGHFLRKSKLDELPQLLNVLKNDMALIGPRPCLPVQKEITELRKRYKVIGLKPGLSGYSQVLKITMEQAEQMVIHDARYNAMRTQALDLLLMLKTPFSIW